VFFFFLFEKKLYPKRTKSKSHLDENRTEYDSISDDEDDNEAYDNNINQQQSASALDMRSPTAYSYHPTMSNNSLQL
jgi:hypothetical protein